MNSKLIFVFLFSLLNFFLFSESYHAQMKKISMRNVRSEGNFYEKNGRLYSDAIVVKFTKLILDFHDSQKYADAEKISDSHSIKKTLKELEKKYGKAKIVKQIPSATWNNPKKHIINGVAKDYDLSQLYSIYFESPIPIDSVVDIFRSRSDVEFAHEPISIALDEYPNDPYFGSQWNLGVINASNAWKISKGNSSVSVAIVDEGVASHEDLSISGGDGLLQGSHGTWVAGVVGAVTNNNIGIASIGGGLSIYSYGEAILGREAYLPNSIYNAASVGNIINMSWHTIRPILPEEVINYCSQCDASLAKKYQNVYWIATSYPEIANAVSYAINTMGRICVAAAGNPSDNTAPDICNPMKIPFIVYPAAYSGVIAVSGTNSSDQFISSFNHNYFVKISAPGESILTTDRSGGYYSPTGTSFSAPHVSGLIGLIKSFNPSLSGSTIFDIIRTTADKVDIL